jgi:hypothetical protein
MINELISGKLFITLKESTLTPASISLSPAKKGRQKIPLKDVKSRWGGGRGEQRERDLGERGGGEAVYSSNT